MMPRVVRFAVADVVLDPKAVATSLRDACVSRSSPRCVTGVCQFDELLAFVLSPTTMADATATQYVLAPVPDTTATGISTVLSERWQAGFDVLGAIAAGEGTFFLVLTARRDASA